MDFWQSPRKLLFSISNFVQIFIGHPLTGKLVGTVSSSATGSKDRVGILHRLTAVPFSLDTTTCHLIPYLHILVISVKAITETERRTGVRLHAS